MQVTSPIITPIRLPYELAYLILLISSSIISLPISCDSDACLSVGQPKVARKSHSFKVMPSNQRRVVHELAEFYGCQTESYDEEPNKNVVATAVK